MGKADYYADGQWNFFCDFCGAKAKSGTAMKTWNGFYVCKHHKEARNPQDYLRGIRDNQSVPWTRPEKVPETFVPQTCTLKGSNAVPGWMIPGCIRPGYVNTAFLPSDPDPSEGPSFTLESLNSIPGFAGAGASIPSYDNMSLPERSQLDTIEGKY